MTVITSFETLVTHIHDENGALVKSSLAAYFYKKAFTGSAFESFIGRDHFRFTADDLIAVSMLSVEVPGSAARWILGDGSATLSILLQQIPPTLSITDSRADLERGGIAWQLWKHIFSRYGIGETTASKLLATKRPQLFPIFDQHVAVALNLSPDNYWGPWQQFMRSKESALCTTQLRLFADDLGLSMVSDLRLFDVVVWMYQHGHTFITKDKVDAGVMIPVSYATPKKVILMVDSVEI